MRAIASICCSPPDSLVPGLLRRSVEIGEQVDRSPRTLMPPSATTGGSSRFSATVRLAKMPRSSGTKPMPRVRRRCSGSRHQVRAGEGDRCPCALRMMPMMARKVVVLPTPLRPSSVTVSPSRDVEIDAVQRHGFRRTRR